jgi:hypothetical protein
LSTEQPLPSQEQLQRPHAQQQGQPHNYPNRPIWHRQKVKQIGRRGEHNALNKNKKYPNKIDCVCFSSFAGYGEPDPTVSRFFLAAAREPTRR